MTPYSSVKANMEGHVQLDADEGVFSRARREVALVMVTSDPDEPVHVN